MKKQATIVSALVFASCLFGAAVSGAPLALPEANVFYTSFESPGYTVGSVYSQHGWTRNGSTLNSAGEVVVGGTDGYPAAPDGSQMLRLRNTLTAGGAYGGAPFASLKFTNEPLAERLYFSGVTGFSGSVSSGTGIISRIYLNNSADNFYGAAFGLHQDNGELRFFYMGTNGSPVSFGESFASADVFYRFEVNMDVVARSYEIRVYDYVTNELLASSENGVFRGNRAATIDNIRLNNASNFPTNGDNFTTYYDQIWISTTPPIPEASSVGFLFGAAALGFLLLRRRLGVCRN